MRSICGGSSVRTPLTRSGPTAAWAPDGSKIYFDRMWGHPLGIYSVPPLGGEPRMLLDEAFGPEPLPDGSLIVVKLTDQGDNQLFHFWPESGKLDALPAFLHEGRHDADAARLSRRQRVGLLRHQRERAVAECAHVGIRSGFAAGARFGARSPGSIREVMAGRRWT